jgi:hypothetical protein
MTFTILNPTLAQTSEEQRLKAETLLNILDTVKTSADEALSRLDAQSIPVPPNAETKYNAGITHAEEAARLMNAENYGEASSEAVEAMQNLKETLILLQEASPVEPTETEAAAQKAINLKANITRAYEHIERLEKLTSKARTAGYNTITIDELSANLSIAKSHLEDASDELDNRNLIGATEKLRKAKALLNELKVLYDRLVNAVKISSTEKYLGAAADRINQTKADITSSATLSPQNKTNAITALDNSENNLADARDHIDKGMVEDAIKELEEAKKWEDESHKYLSPSVTATPTGVQAADKALQSTGPTASK